MDTHFRPLSRDQYRAIIQGGTLPGYSSPMDTDANYQALITVCQAADMDPRWILAFTWAEGHHGSDPGLAAAVVNNLGGVKYVGQAGAKDSGIPADTGGTYAAFPDLTGYFQEFVRIMHNGIIGPYYAAGDLVSVVEHYTNGPGTGHNKLDQYQAYLNSYPADGTLPAASGIYGEDLIRLLATQIGHPNSGTFDTLNGDHPWAYWCEAAVESDARDEGLAVVARMSALDKLNAAAAQGLLHTDGTPEHGAQVFFDRRFYSPDGHTGLWDDDRKQLLGTLTDGTGVGYRDWGPATFGYAGWMRIPGVIGPRRPQAPTPPPVINPHTDNLVIPDNPYNAGRVKPFELGVGGGIRAAWEALADRALPILGYPIENETQLVIVEPDGATKKQRTCQRFERDLLIYIPENTGVWQVVSLLHGQRWESA